jgi:multifunctional methyltransferase subunit TRM112
VTDLPAAATEDMLEDDDFLKKFHHALLEVQLEEGSLVCPETGAFAVFLGVPSFPGGSYLLTAT